MTDLSAPFPWFGGKSAVAAAVWERFGSVRQYIEPFCGSAAVLLAAPSPASLEVIGDANGFVANFWRAVKRQPEAVASEADYPVSHIDLGARHVWLLEQCARLEAELQDPLWPGDARVAGWGLWGQCCWIGSGWCDWLRSAPPGGQIPHVGNAGRGVQAIGQIPHVGNAPDVMTSCGRTAWVWLRALAARLERVRVIHGDWSRCLNHSYGGPSTAVFLDPPYAGLESLYGAGTARTADDVAGWAMEHSALRIALCGHAGDYSLPGWEQMPWKRPRRTYGSDATTDRENIWFSPACLSGRQGGLFR